MFSSIALAAGLVGSYQIAVVAVAVVGTILSLRLVGLGGPVRPLTTLEGGHEFGEGPVASMTKAIDGAVRGSYFFQAQIAAILRPGFADRPREPLMEVLEPLAEGRRLKGDKYLSELEAAVRVLKHD